ncbi:unnamed protein product [Boreogadus saida]
MNNISTSRVASSRTRYTDEEYRCCMAPSQSTAPQCWDGSLLAHRGNRAFPNLPLMEHGALSWLAGHQRWGWEWAAAGWLQERLAGGL